MRNRIIIAAVLVSATVTAAALYAQQKGGVKPLTALDYAELQQLYVTYYQTSDSGADDCMNKPCSPRLLRQKLHELLSATS